MNVSLPQVLMESNAATLSLCTPPKVLRDENGALIFDPNLLQNHIPKEFVWPSEDLVSATQEELNEPLIDLLGAMKGDEEALAAAAELVRNACSKHGFFQVTNHGVNPNLIRDAYREIDSIFKLPMSTKLGARRKLGGFAGYSGAHADRFSSKLPWKETFSFQYNHDDGGSENQVVDYFKSVFGEGLQHTGWVYQKYCEAMKELSLVIMELLAISLGVDRMHYRRYFQDGESIMRCNYYPTCNSSNVTLGIGPHNDPTSLTILHQDQVGGLQVFSDNKWFVVGPRPQAFVINIGDTFAALCNGRYKSCLHRALVNEEMERRSLVFFVSPKADKIVRPPEDLCGGKEPRRYPDFTWSDLFEFTQKHYRVDGATLQGFFQWLRSSKPSNF